MPEINVAVEDSEGLIVGDVTVSLFSSLMDIQYGDTLLGIPGETVTWVDPEDVDGKVIPLLRPAAVLVEAVDQDNNGYTKTLRFKVRMVNNLSVDLTQTVDLTKVIVYGVIFAGAATALFYLLHSHFKLGGS